MTFTMTIRTAEEIEAELDPGPPVLTPRQFEWLLAMTGLEDVWAAVEQGAKATDRRLYAGLRAQRSSGAFLLNTTLTFKNEPAVAAVAASVAPEVDLSDEAITEAWMQAAAQTFDTLT